MFYGEELTAVDCRWLISAPPSNIVTLTFLDFEMDIDPNNEDLSVYDGSNLNGQLLERLYGINLPTAFSSSGNDIYVRFRSTYGSLTNFTMGRFEIELNTAGICIWHVKTLYDQIRASVQVYHYLLMNIHVDRSMFCRRRSTRKWAKPRIMYPRKSLYGKWTMSR